MLCILGHPQDENIGMVAAGASEQQEQHELEEESGELRKGGRERVRKTEEERKIRRAVEERMDEKIPSRRVLAMCDPV